MWWGSRNAVAIGAFLVVVVVVIVAFFHIDGRVPETAAWRVISQLRCAGGRRLCLKRTDKDIQASRVDSTGYYFGIGPQWGQCWWVV